MELPTKRFAAMLVAGVAFAPTLAGCGQNEPTKATTGGAASVPTTPEATATTAVLPGTVDFNDPKELAAALASLGIDTPPVEPAGVERSVVDGAAFPTWPSGDVRKAGLKTYRVDVSASFDGKAFLKFFHGKKELYSAPFDPASTTTVATIPAVVVESLKTGDRVTWGVYFEKKSAKPVTVDFTITDKAAAAKKVGEVDANKGLSVLGRMIAKAQVLKNYSFLSEALTTYVDIAKADDSITSVYADMVDCMRRLKLKNTPLFADAQMRMINVPGVRPGSKQPFGVGGGGLSSTGGGGLGTTDVPSGNKGKMAPIGPTAVAKTSGKTTSGPKQGGGGLPPLPTPPAPTDPAMDEATPAGDPMAQGFAAAKALAQAAMDARSRANTAERMAAAAKEAADAAQAEANAEAAKMAEFAAKAADFRAQATDMTNGLTDAERQNLMDQAMALEQTAAAAKVAADAAAAKAAEKAALAEKLSHDAQRLDAEADNLEKGANAALGVVDPQNPGGLPKNGATPPGGLDPNLPKSGQMIDKIAALTQVVQAAQTNLAVAEQRARDAQAAFDAAQGQPAEVVNAAKAELDAANQALADAGGTLDAAQKALNEASK